MLRIVAFVGSLLAVAPALAQSTLLQGGPWAPGRAPMYTGSGSGQAVVQDSGPAGGGAIGLGLSELGITKRGSGTPPFANGGTGPLSTSFCILDAPATNATGYHYLCFDPNAQGGGLIAYGAGGTASALPFNFNINGTTITPAGGITNITVNSTTIGGGTANCIAYDVSGIFQCLATANNSVLTTNGSGVPSYGTTLPSGILGPATTVLGNIAFWNATDGTKLGAAPAFQAANPGRAALYSQLATVADGTVTVNNGMQLSIGTALPSTEQFGSNPHSAAASNSQAVVGTFTSNSTDVVADQGWGVVGYSKCLAAAINCTGTAGYGKVAVTNGNAWGGNFVVHNASPISPLLHGFDANSMIATEFDVGVWLKPGSVEPTIPQLYGIYIYGDGDSTANQGTAVAIAGLGFTNSTKWTNSFVSQAGGAVNAFIAGPTAKTGNNLSSQPYIWQSTNGAGTVIPSTALSDGSGNLFIKPNSGFLGVGATQLAPDSPITLNANTGVAVAPIAGTALHVVGADTANAVIGVDTYVNAGAGGPLWVGRNSRGTQASKTAVQATDLLSTFTGQGWDTAAYGTGASVQLRATETYSGTAHGGEVALRTVINGTTTVADVLVARNTGGATLNRSANPPAGVFDVGTGFQVAGAATSGNVLRGNGTNFVSAQLSATDIAGNTAVFNGAPANPTGTASTTLVMMGIGATCTITTTTRTRVRFTITGSMNNNTAADSAKYQMSFGPSTAPTNGAAISGTVFGTAAVSYLPASGGGATAVPFTATGIATGLSTSTAYWFDIQLAAITGGTASIQSLGCSAEEI